MKDSELKNKIASCFCSTELKQISIDGNKYIIETRYGLDEEEIKAIKNLGLEFVKVYVTGSFLDGVFCTTVWKKVTNNG